MNDELTEVDNGGRKAIMEEIIKRVRPGAEVSWISENGKTEIRTLRVRLRGNKLQAKNQL